MYQLVETIKCDNGKLINLKHHQARFDLSREVHFGHRYDILLSETIAVPDGFRTGVYKCRLIYSDIIEKIEFLPYKNLPVQSLMMVANDHIEYPYKYTSRKELDQLFEQRGDCDDILIIKNGFITDSFIANVAFFDGKKWWTPDTPLLHGTQRARLIEEGKLHVRSITPADINKYLYTGLINAMNDLEEMQIVETNKIVTETR